MKRFENTFQYFSLENSLKCRILTLDFFFTLLLILLKLWTIFRTLKLLSAWKIEF